MMKTVDLEQELKSQVSW